MTDREKIMSNEYYDLTTDYILPPELRPADSVYQPVSEEIGVTFVNRQEVPPLSLDDYGYPVIPKLYALSALAPGSGMGGGFNPLPLIQSGISQVQRSPLALTGRGVVLGFLDTGIRYQEEVFRREDGSSRILGIWDQEDQSGRPPEGILYGTEYTKAEIDRALGSENPLEIVPSTDTRGHGTALASVAAGGILENGLLFQGAAPEADIVMVKLRQAKPHLKEYYQVSQETPAYAEGDLLVGLKYLESYARSLIKPLVICIGLGSSLGDHEGHSVLADYLNKIATKRSRIVIVGGGEEGNSAHHYVGSSAEGLVETLDNVEIRVGEGEKGFVAQLWGSIPANHAISIRAPGGETTPRVDFLGQQSREFTFIYEQTRIQVNHVLVEPSSGEELIFFRFLAPTPGVWTIQVYISNERNIASTFHLWLPVTEFLSGSTYFLRPSPYTTLTEPGNALEAVTVSTYDSDGGLWSESGRGYTRLGRTKPVLAAPGVGISIVTGSNPAAGSPTVIGSGTGSCLAAALTAGAAAQFMQWAVVEGNRNLVESRELRNYLIRGAERTLGEVYPNREFGYGRLDIAGTFRVLAGV